jgi:hypothetical protein
MFDSLTDAEWRELKDKLFSASAKFSAVTLSLGNVVLKTLGTLAPESEAVWSARARFKRAGDDAYDLAMELSAS